MLNRIIQFSISNKLIVALFTFMLIGWGVYSFTRLPIDAVPDITNNQVQVITVSPSNGAEDIERFVTFPVEQTMATIPGIEEIRSFSRFGLSVVTIVFKEDIDIYWARQQVNERLSSVNDKIPSGMGAPELAPLTTGLGEIFQYVIHTKKGYGQKYSAMDLRTIQDWIVRRQMLGVEGVADVASFGGYLKQYEVALNPEKLRSMNISIAEVFDALAKNNQNTGGAYIDKNPNAWFVRSIGLIGNMEDIGNIVVKNTSGNVPVLIRNVGTVQVGSAIRYGAMTRNNEGEVTGAVVMMLKGENSSAVIRRVKERMAQIEKTLPEGIIVEPFLDRTKLVDSAIKTVSTNLIEGALIVIFVLVILLGNLRGGLIVASVIPLAMLFAVSLMNIFGVSGNLMSLGAIDFGLIVDGAVIIVEATIHQLGLSRQKQLDQPQMDLEVGNAAKKMMNAAAFGQIIILIVYFPILTLTGIEGKMFRPMAQTVSFAIIGALILSLTYVPMMSALFLSKKISHKKTISDSIIAVVQRVYEPMLRGALRAKAITIGAAVVLLVASVWLFTRMGSEFIPTLGEGDFAVETRVLTGSSLSKTVDAAGKSADVLMKKFPEVKQVVGKIGSSEIPTDPMPVELCDLIVVLKDKKEWVSADSREELAAKMQAELEKNIPGVTYGFQQPIQMRFNELMSGARQDVVVKIFGEDLDQLGDYARRIGKIAGTIEGAVDVYVEQATGLPQVLVKFRRDKIAQFGLDIETVNQVIRAGFAGDAAGQIFENERRFDLVVRLDKSNRQTVEDLRTLYVTASNGNQIPLEQLADVEIRTGPNQIQREDARRRIMVGFNVRGKDVATVVADIKKRIENEVKFGPGYYAAYGGTFENLQEARQRLAIAVPVALLLILFLLYFAFGSLKYGLLIFTAIPLSAIGGIIALWLRDMPFSISAGVGFIALFGVAVLNGIVLIAEFNRLKKEGMDNLTKIVITGTRIRLRPVIMTATVASLGFIPMALSGGSGAEVQRPLATVVIGGLVTATLLTLLVLPCLYMLFEKIGGGGRKLATATTVIALLVFGPAMNATAQTANPLTLQQAVDLAVKQHPAMQSSKLMIERERALRGTSTDLGKTNISGQYGQANTIKWDNHFSLTQEIPNPGLYGKQKQLADAKIKSSELNLAVTKQELVMQVKSAWYQLAWLQSVKYLLQRQDTLFRNFLKAAELRYKTGETRMLEQSTAQTRLNENNNQIQRNEADIQIAQTNLQRLLNTSETVTVAAEGIHKLDGMAAPAATLPADHPLTAYLQQEIKVNEQLVRVEKAKAGPDFSIGYFNQSIYGFQNVGEGEKFYDRSKRFQGVTASVAFPLFNKPFSSRIKAAKVDQQIAESNLELARNNLNGQYREAVQQYEKEKKNLQYYESSALPNAELMLKQAQRAFQAGEISYVEYLQALQTGSEIRMNYLQAIRDMNLSVVTLEYFQPTK